jgi:ABC-type cobalamin/Fe3+-siderophores transport system ATPase subunit
MSDLTRCLLDKVTVRRMVEGLNRAGKSTLLKVLSRVRPLPVGM